MVDIASSHRRALEATRPIVAGITAEQMSTPTLDGDWDVRTLLNHVVSGNFWAVELGSGATIDEVGDRLDGDIVGDDWLGAWDRSAVPAAAVFEEPGALERPCAVSYGPVPGAVYAGHRFIDVLIHGWDLAKATGHDTRLDPELVDDCIEVLEPQLAMLQGSGAFGAPVAVDPSADAQTRLLGMLGRKA